MEELMINKSFCKMYLKYCYLKISNDKSILYGDLIQYILNIVAQDGAIAVY